MGFSYYWLTVICRINNVILLGPFICLPKRFLTPVMRENKDLNLHSFITGSKMGL